VHVNATVAEDTVTEESRYDADRSSSDDATANYSPEVTDDAQQVNKVVELDYYMMSQKETLNFDHNFGKR